MGSPRQLFIVLLFSSAGIILTVISQFTGIFYYFDEHNIYHKSTFYHLSVARGLLPWLITFSMFMQNRKSLKKNVFNSFLIYFIFQAAGLILILFIYGFSWINIFLGVGAIHLFFSSIKLMEIEFYSGDRESALLNPVYQKVAGRDENQKRVVRNHFWQTMSVSLGGIILFLVIISTTIMLFEGKLIRIEEENKKLEKTVRERTKELEAEKKRSESLFDYNESTEIDVKGKGMMKTYFL